ncbi:hypothetical protein [Paeniglutamicibacter kerguelensis]|uniref:Uncharacterized protein n=1 Tax=Paeniglutamicibacter kerguelensis TaxID=254788 RepID=A0ABS4XEB3_9MICC|nr:hypothetical protein [Paeniglutamicibacter kerguelensis]MBP2386804.1 hypothetical protein [Paeniglutamicibacter kerguelensis]
MAPAAPNASAASGTEGQAPLRIHYDRVAIALLGCLSVVALVIGGILALAGVFSGWVPMAGLLLGVASFSALRTLAVRARRAKLLARMESTRQLAMEPKAEPVQATVKKQRDVFDAQPDSNKRPPRLTVEELRAEALRIANNGAAVQRPEGWKPTEVPLPQYVVANAVKRPAPEALEVEAERKPSTKTSLRAQEAGQRLTEAVETVENPVDDKSAATIEAAAAKARLERASRTGDRMNLDDVMQRRRA